jgi:hypothetical protein
MNKRGTTEREVATEQEPLRLPASDRIEAAVDACRQSEERDPEQQDQGVSAADPELPGDDTQEARQHEESDQHEQPGPATHEHAAAPRALVLESPESPLDTRGGRSGSHR